MIRKEKGRVDVYGDRFRARAHQLTPRLLQVARYIHDNREAVMEQTAMEIATLLKTSDATVVRAIQALGFRRAARSQANAGAVVWSGGHLQRKDVHHGEYARQRRQREH